MATPNQARFLINGTPSVDPTTGDREYTAVLAETLTCTLEANPSLALSATFEVFDPNDSESPFASKDAPLRTWNENGLPAITVGQVPLGINDDVTIDMPAAVGPPLPNIHSYVIRCTVSTPGDGSPASQVQVFERQVLIFGTNTDPVLRKTVPGESTQARVRAWSDSLNDLIDAMENLGVVVSGSLQAAYIAGNTIGVSAGEGPLTFSGTVAGATSPLDVVMDGTSVIKAEPTGAVNIRTVAGQNFNVTVDAGGDVELNAPSGDVTFSAPAGIIGLAAGTEINLDVGGLPFIKLANTTLGFRKDVIAPFIGQDDETVDAVAGDRLTIVAQAATGLAAAGGDLLLLGAAGTALGGSSVIRAGLGGTGNGVAGFSDATGVGAGFIDGAGAIFMLPLSGEDFTASATGAGGDIVLQSAAGVVLIDAVAGELTLDDVGNSALTLSQNNDRVLDQTGAGEVLSGATSTIGALNRLARTSTLPGFIQGLHYANDGVTPDEIIDIDPGSAASDDGTFLIESGSTLSPDITAGGLNGLDTGAVAADTWYAVWVIADSAGVEPVGSLLSLSFTEGGLAFPTDYDKARRVGAVRTDATADIQTFGQPKVAGVDRWSYWKDAVNIQVNGTATTYTNTATSAALRVAPPAVKQQIAMTTTKLGGSEAGALASVVPDGWNEAAGNLDWRVTVGVDSNADVTTTGIFEMPVGPSRLVRYLVAPAGAAQTTIRVQGWEDSL